MTQEQIAFLYKHKVMYHNFKVAGVIPHLAQQDAKIFLEIAKTFNPDYSASLWCADCVMDMVQYVYVQAEKLAARNKQEENKTIEQAKLEVIVTELKKRNAKRR